MIEAARFQAGVRRFNNRKRQEIIPISKEKRWRHSTEKRTPITIRGHHITKYRQLLNGQSPVTIAQETTTAYIPSPRELFGFEMTPRHVTAAWETVDTIGTTRQEQITHEKGETLLYETFLNAPADYPIEFLEERPDDICGLCTVGKHCIERGNGDTAYMDYFLTIIKDRAPGLIEDGSVKLYRKKVTFSDGITENKRVLVTTVGVFNKLVALSLQLHPVKDVKTSK